MTGAGCTLFALPDRLCTERAGRWGPSFAACDVPDAEDLLAMTPVPVPRD